MMRHLTQARVALKRHGNSLSTEEHLAMLEAQSLARDSLWRDWDTAALENYLQGIGQDFCNVESQAKNRQDYLLRPDWGRVLTKESETALGSFRKNRDCEVVICISDGLATDAINRHAQPFLENFLPRLKAEAFARGRAFPIVLAPRTRVAAQDAIGEALGARLTVMLVGERPGSSAHDSLGIYLTFDAKKGTLDGRRNCISNVRPPHGLSYAQAIEQLLYLMRESLRLKLSGVELKIDESALAAIAPPAP